MVNERFFELRSVDGKRDFFEFNLCDSDKSFFRPGEEPVDG
jgi:hypothetical protein